MMIINDDRGDVEQYQKADMTMLCFMALGAKYHSPQIMQPTFSCQAAAWHIKNTKYKIQNTKYKIQNTKYKIHVLSCQNTKYVLSWTVKKVLQAKKEAASRHKSGPASRHWESGDLIVDRPTYLHLDLYLYMSTYKYERHRESGDLTTFPLLHSQIVQKTPSQMNVAPWLVL